MAAPSSRILTVGAALLVVALLLMPVASLFHPGTGPMAHATAQQSGHCSSMASCPISPDCSGVCPAASGGEPGNPHTPRSALVTLSLDPVTLTVQKPPPKLA